MVESDGIRRFEKRQADGFALPASGDVNRTKFVRLVCGGVSRQVGDIRRISSDDLNLHNGGAGLRYGYSNEGVSNSDTPFTEI